MTLLIRSLYQVSRCGRLDPKMFLTPSDLKLFYAREMPLKLLSASFFFALLVSTVNAAEEQTCIEPSFASVSGLIPGMDKDSLNSIDKYYSVETASGEDDSGYYQALIYHYAQYEITIVHDMLDSIRITSPGFLWAQKINIGSDRTMVEKHIATSPVADDVNSSQYLVCSDAGDVYAIFRYQDNKVKSIDLVIDRP